MIFNLLELEVYSHTLNPRIIPVGAVFTGLPIVELLGTWERGFIKSLKLVTVFVAKHFILFSQLNYLILDVKINVSNCVRQKDEVLLSGFSKSLDSRGKLEREELSSVAIHDVRTTFHLEVLLHVLTDHFKCAVEDVEISCTIRCESYTRWLWNNTGIW